MDFQAMFRAELAAQRAAEAAAAAASSTVVHPAPPPPPLIPLGLGISYCGGFLSPQEQAALTSAIDAIPQRDWALLPKRRLLNLGGVPFPQPNATNVSKGRRRRRSRPARRHPRPARRWRAAQRAGGYARPPSRPAQRAGGYARPPSRSSTL